MKKRECPHKVVGGPAVSFTVGETKTESILGDRLVHVRVAGEGGVVYEVKGRLFPVPDLDLLSGEVSNDG